MGTASRLRVGALAHTSSAVSDARARDGIPPRLPPLVEHWDYVDFISDIFQVPDQAWNYYLFLHV